MTPEARAAGVAVRRGRGIVSALSAIAFALGAVLAFPEPESLPLAALGGMSFTFAFLALCLPYESGW
jgi:hypothetical protein